MKAYFLAIAVLFSGILFFIRFMEGREVRNYLQGEKITGTIVDKSAPRTSSGDYFVYLKLRHKGSVVERKPFIAKKKYWEKARRGDSATIHFVKGDARYYEQDIVFGRGARLESSLRSRAAGLEILQWIALALLVAGLLPVIISFFRSGGSLKGAARLGYGIGMSFFIFGVSILGFGVLSILNVLFELGLSFGFSGASETDLPTDMTGAMFLFSIGFLLSLPGFYLQYRKTVLRNRALIALLFLLALGGQVYYYVALQGRLQKRARLSDLIKKDDALALRSELGRRENSPRKLDELTWTAIRLNAPGSLRVLIEAGGRPAPTDYWTALSLAAYRSSPETLGVLLEKRSLMGLDVRQKNGKSRTPLWGPAITGRAPDLLGKKIEKRKARILRLLLDAGLSPNEPDKNGHTALMAASSRGLAGLAKILIQAGAKVNARDRFGGTALLYSIRGFAVLEKVSEKKRLAVLALLLKAGADCGPVKTRSGYTRIPRAYAKNYKLYKIEAFLKEKGCPTE